MSQVSDAGAQHRVLHHQLLAEGTGDSLDQVLEDAGVAPVMPLSEVFHDYLDDRADAEDVNDITAVAFALLHAIKSHKDAEGILLRAANHLQGDGIYITAFTDHDEEEAEDA